MTDQMQVGSVRARHLFRRYVQIRAQCRPITPADLPAYQAQTREVLEQYGNDYTEQWLQGWVDVAQAELDAKAQRSAGAGMGAPDGAGMADGQSSAHRTQHDGISPEVARILACKGHIA